MINLDAVIRAFGAQALRMQLAEEKTDSKALTALKDRAALNRPDAIRRWLESYRAFQGIPGANRSAIASTIVDWADARDMRRDLTTADSLDRAHAEITALCVRANGRQRDFTSLASKALWLCYPESVPIYDTYARRALWVISKLERDLSTLAESDLEYRKFVHVWKALYDRYASAINSIDIGGYPYRVRIFDKILWLIGEPRYSRSVY